MLTISQSEFQFLSSLALKLVHCMSHAVTPVWRVCEEFVVWSHAKWKFSSICNITSSLCFWPETGKSSCYHYLFVGGMYIGLGCWVIISTQIIYAPNTAIINFCHKCDSTWSFHWLWRCIVVPWTMVCCYVFYLTNWLIFCCFFNSKLLFLSFMFAGNTILALHNLA